MPRPVVNQAWLDALQGNTSLRQVAYKLGGRTNRILTNSDIDFICPRGIELGFWQELHFVERENLVLVDPTIDYITLIVRANTNAIARLRERKHGYLAADGTRTAKVILPSVKFRRMHFDFDPPRPGAPPAPEGFTTVGKAAWNDIWRGRVELVALAKHGGDLDVWVSSHLDGLLDWMSIQRLIEQGKLPEGYERPKTDA